MIKIFLTHIADVFSKISNAISKHGIIIGIVVALVIIIIYSALVHPINMNDIVQKAFDKEKKEQVAQVKESIDKRLNADAIVEPILEDIVEKFDLSRAIVFEKHNGTQSLSGVDFLYFSATLEILNVNNVNLEYIGEHFQRLYTSNYLGNLVKTLKYKDYFYLDNIYQCTHRSHSLLKKLNQYDINSVLLVTYKNKNNTPLIIIAFCSQEKEIPYKDILQELKQYNSIIKSALIYE